MYFLALFAAPVLYFAVIFIDILQICPPTEAGSTQSVRFMQKKSRIMW